MSTVSTREWLRQSTGRADQEQVDEDLKGAAEEPDPGHRPAPAGRRDRQERLRRGGSQIVSAAPGAGDVPRYPDPLPGKLPHILHAAQALPAQSPPLDVGPARPAYGGMMAHGVPAPVEHGGRPAPKPEHATALMANRVPESYQPPPRPSPVPVYLVPEGAGARPLKRVATKQVLVPGPSTAGAPAIPAQVCGKDPRRTTVRLMNETPAGATGVPMRVLTDQVSTVPAAAGGSVEGSLLPAGMTSYQDFQTQDELFVVVDPNSVGTAAAYLSVIIEYSVPNGA